MRGIGLVPRAPVDTHAERRHWNGKLPRLQPVAFGKGSRHPRWCDDQKIRLSDHIGDTGIVRDREFRFRPDAVFGERVFHRAVAGVGRSDGNVIKCLEQPARQPRPGPGIDRVTAPA